MYALICRISFFSEHVPQRSPCKETVAGARSSVCVPWMIQPASVQFVYPPGGAQLCFFPHSCKSEDPDPLLHTQRENFMCTSPSCEGSVGSSLLVAA